MEVDGEGARPRRTERRTAVRAASGRGTKRVRAEDEENAEVSRTGGATKKTLKVQPSQTRAVASASASATQEGGPIRQIPVSNELYFIILRSNYSLLEM